MDEGDVSSTTVKLCLPWTWRPFKRHMLPGCQLFVDGDRLLHSSRKLLPLEDDSEADDRDASNMYVVQGELGYRNDRDTNILYVLQWNMVTVMTETPTSCKFYSGAWLL